MSESVKLEWSPVKIRLGQIRPWTENPRMSTKADAHRLIRSEREMGQVQTFAIGPADAEGFFPLYDGHQRYSAWMTVYPPTREVWALQSNRPLTDDERKKLPIMLHTSTGRWDFDKLANGWSVADLRDWGMDDEKYEQWKENAKQYEQMIASERAEEAVDAEPQIDRAEELREKWGVQLGDMFAVGEHRIICGDCTDAAVAARVMGNDIATLLHADPPYGMGKENEGIVNDNLYREKLDAFQMQWWKACRPFLADNGSVYIWGNAEDLWRLWYCGGLRDSERLTMRNEIVWEKQNAQGIATETHRQYPTATERCLFFMLGEQGFNNNADNYWDAWTPIVDYLESSRQAMGWSIKDTKRIAGHSEKSGCHWFDKSQWMMPTEETYKAWQVAANGDAFKREYDELKREFYATRAYFDNTHDNMTDVWEFGRVTGDDRHGHATPKPVAMMERIIKSSSRAGDVVLVPFNGSAPELVACQNLNRRCRAIEISPAYVAVALERMVTAFPGIEIRKL